MTWWFYAVAAGGAPGVYASWRAARAETQYFPGGRLKKFKTFREAEAFVQAHGSSGGARFVVDPVADARRKAPPRKPHPRQRSTLVAFCDAAVVNAGTATSKRPRAAYACVFPYCDRWNQVAALEAPSPTKHRGECLAALAAVRRANIEDPGQTRVLYVFSSSRYLIHAMTGAVHLWLRSGWRKLRARRVSGSGLAGGAFEQEVVAVPNRDVLSCLLEELGRREVIWRLVAPVGSSSSSSSSSSLSSSGQASWEATWRRVARDAAVQAARAWASSGTVAIVADGVELGRSCSELARYEVVCVADQVRSRDTDNASVVGGGIGANRVGFACVFSSKEVWNVIDEVLDQPRTREHALLMAVLSALERVNRDDPKGEHPLLVYTDSPELVQLMTAKVPVWADRGWRDGKGAPVPLRVILQRIVRASENRHVSWQGSAEKEMKRRFGLAHQLARRRLAVGQRLPSVASSTTGTNLRSRASTMSWVAFNE